MITPLRRSDQTTRFSQRDRLLVDLRRGARRRRTRGQGLGRLRRRDDTLGRQRQHGLILQPGLAQLVPDDADEQHDRRQEDRTDDQEYQPDHPGHFVHLGGERIHVEVVVAVDADMPVTVLVFARGRFGVVVRRRGGRIDLDRGRKGLDPDRGVGFGLGRGVVGARGVRHAGERQRKDDQGAAQDGGERRAGAWLRYGMANLPEWRSS